MFFPSSGSTDVRSSFGVSTFYFSVTKGVEVLFRNLCVFSRGAQKKRKAPVLCQHILLCPKVVGAKNHFHPGDSQKVWTSMTCHLFFVKNLI